MAVSGERAWLASVYDQQSAADGNLVAVVTSSAAFISR